MRSKRRRRAAAVYPPPCLSIERSLAKKQPSSAPKTPPKFHEAPPPLPRTRRKARGPRRSKRRSHELLLLLLRTASICHARVHQRTLRFCCPRQRAGSAFRGDAGAHAYAAVFPGGNPTRGQGSTAAKATEPPTLAKGLAFSTRSRGRSAARVAESSRLSVLDLTRARLEQTCLPSALACLRMPPRSHGWKARVDWLATCMYVVPGRPSLPHVTGLLVG
jgi:hypothetical protein